MESEREAFVDRQIEAFMDVVDPFTHLIPSEQLDDSLLLGQRLEYEVSDEFAPGRNGPDDSLKNMLSDKDPMLGSASSQFHLEDSDDFGILTGDGISVVKRGRGQSTGARLQRGGRRGSRGGRGASSASMNTPSPDAQGSVRGRGSRGGRRGVSGRGPRVRGGSLSRSSLSRSDSEASAGRGRSRELLLSRKFTRYNVHEALPAYMSPVVLLRRLSVVIGGVRIELIPGPSLGGWSLDQGGSQEDGLLCMDGMGLSVEDGVSMGMGITMNAEEMVSAELPAVVEEAVPDAPVAKAAAVAPAPRQRKVTSDVPLGPYVNPNDVQNTNGSLLFHKPARDVPVKLDLKAGGDQNLKSKLKSSKVQEKNNVVQQQPESPTKHVKSKEVLPSSPDKAKPTSPPAKLGTARKSLSLPSLKKVFKAVPKSPAGDAKEKTAALNNTVTLKRPAELIKLGPSPKMQKVGRQESSSPIKSPVKPGAPKPHGNKVTSASTATSSKPQSPPPHGHHHHASHPHPSLHRQGSHSSSHKKPPPTSPSTPGPAHSKQKPHLHQQEKEVEKESEEQEREREKEKEKELRRLKKERMLQRRNARSISVEEPELFIPDNAPLPPSVPPPPVAQKEATVEEEVEEEEEEAAEADGEAPGHLHCGICKKPHSNRFMVGCGRCDDWFHGDCVGLDLDKVQQMEQEDQEYVCLRCCEAEEDSGAPTRPETSTAAPEPTAGGHGHGSDRLATATPTTTTTKEPPPTPKNDTHHHHHHQPPSSRHGKQPGGVTTDGVRPFRKDSTHSERRHSSESKDATYKPDTHKKSEKHKAKVSPVKQPSTDQIRRNVRHTLKDILHSRLKDSDFKVSSDKVSEVSKKIERELHAFFQGTDSKYKSKYRSLTFNLKDTKNNVLFKRVLQGEISPGDLIRMSPEELASKELAAWRQRENRHAIEMIEKEQREVERRPITKITHKGEIEIENQNQEPLKAPDAMELEPEPAPKVPEEPEEKPVVVEAEPVKDTKDTTSLHKSHLFDLNCKICTGRMAPPVEEPATKVVKVATTVTKRPSASELEPTRAPSPDIADELDALEGSLMTSGIYSSFDGRSETSSGKDDPSTFLANLESLWNGFVDMAAVAKLLTKAYPVSGTLDHLTEDLPENIQVGGRISPQIVWDYVEKIRASGTKELCVIRFTPETEEDEISYTLLYAYFSSRRRYGVVANNRKQVKDMYLIPLGSTEKIPHQIVPFDGPGLETNRPNLLLGLIIRQRPKRDYGAILPMPPSSSDAVLPKAEKTSDPVIVPVKVRDEENHFMSSLKAPIGKEAPTFNLPASGDPSGNEPIDTEDSSADFGLSDPSKPLRFLPGVLASSSSAKQASKAAADVEEASKEPSTTGHQAPITSDPRTLGGSAKPATPTSLNRFIIKKKDSKLVKVEAGSSSETLKSDAKPVKKESPPSGDSKNFPSSTEPAKKESRSPSPTEKCAAISESAKETDLSTHSEKSIADSEKSIADSKSVKSEAAVSIAETSSSPLPSATNTSSKSLLMSMKDKPAGISTEAFLAGLSTPDTSLQLPATSDSLMKEDSLIGPDVPDEPPKPDSTTAAVLDSTAEEIKGFASPTTSPEPNDAKTLTGLKDAAPEHMDMKDPRVPDQSKDVMRGGSLSAASMPSSSDPSLNDYRPMTDIQSIKTISSNCKSKDSLMSSRPPMLNTPPPKLFHSPAPPFTRPRAPGLHDAPFRHGPPPPMPNYPTPSNPPPFLSVPPPMAPNMGFPTPPPPMMFSPGPLPSPSWTPPPVGPPALPAGFPPPPLGMLPPPRPPISFGNQGFADPVPLPHVSPKEKGPEPQRYHDPWERPRQHPEDASGHKKSDTHHSRPRHHSESRHEKKSRRHDRDYERKHERRSRSKSRSRRSYSRSRSRSRSKSKERRHKDRKHSKDRHSEKRKDRHHHGEDSSGRHKDKDRDKHRHEKKKKRSKDRHS